MSNLLHLKNERARLASRIEEKELELQAGNSRRLIILNELIELRSEFIEIQHQIILFLSEEASITWKSKSKALEDIESITQNADVGVIH